MTSIRMTCLSPRGDAIAQRNAAFCAMVCAGGYVTAMLEDIRANLGALRTLARDLSPGEVEEATAREIRVLAQMVLVLTEGLAAVIDELERLKETR